MGRGPSGGGGLGWLAPAAGPWGRAGPARRGRLERLGPLLPSRQEPGGDGGARRPARGAGTDTHGRRAADPGAGTAGSAWRGAEEEATELLDGGRARGWAWPCGGVAEHH